MQPKLAILKLVLDELDVPADIATLDDRKRVQKAIYLAQRAGVDLGYRHGWYKRGPYSPGLTRDYYALAEAIAAGEGTADLKLPNDARRGLTKIKPLFTVPGGVNLPEEDWLELLASVEFLSTISALNEGEVDDVVRTRKESLHQYIEPAKQALKEYGVLPA